MNRPRTSADAPGTVTPQANLPAALTVWTTYLLWQAATRATSAVAAALAELGLRPPHNTVLTMLAAGPLAQVTLAAQLHIDRTTMVSLIDDLEQRELVIRRRNAHDRRAHDVTLTEQGATVLARTNAAVTGADDAFFATLSAPERAQLRALLLRLIAAHDASSAER